MVDLYWHSLSFVHNHEYIFGNKKIIKAQPSNYGNRIPGLDMQWHRKLLWNIHEKIWRKCKLELSLPWANSYEQSQLQPKSFYCNQSWKNSITYAKYMQKICVRIGMCYLCTIHIIDAYSSTTRKNASPSMYLGGLGEGGGSKKKIVLSFATSPLREAIYVYTHYMCFSSFLFPGDLHDSLGILWQPLRKSDNLCRSLVIS